MTDITYARGVTFEDFDPNKQFSARPMWGVFDGYRFKSYTQRGHALNGMHHHHRAKLYELTPGGWVLRATRDGFNKPTTCDNCGGTTMGYEVFRHWDHRLAQYNTTTSPHLTNRGAYCFRRRARKYVEPIEMLFVCEACEPVVNS